MADHRFYVGDDVLPGALRGSELVVGGETAHRIVRVLRMKAGDCFTLFGGGREVQAELLAAREPVLLRVCAELPSEPERSHLTLYQALIRPNRFEWLLEKITELGASSVVPIVTERTTVRPAEMGAERQARWRRIAVEASEQSGRGTVPSIAAPVDFRSALTSAEGLLVLACEALRADRGGLAGTRDRESPLSLFIGPEGGWTEAELDQARAAGAELIGLGPNILRAETAAIVASALLLLD